MISAFDMSEVTENMESATDILEISLRCPLDSGNAIVRDGLCLILGIEFESSGCLMVWSSDVLLLAIGSVGMDAHGVLVESTEGSSEVDGCMSFGIREV